ncbi:MAG: serine--tRNA ligase, partial [Bacteroidetes bacterium]|nr:serine--tRNA ligase [Bacteroidota bacterium]
MTDNSSTVMIPIQTIRENPQLVVERLALKQFNAENLVEQILDIDKKRRLTQNEADALKAEANKAAKEIGLLYKEGKTDEANAIREKVTASKEQVHNLDQLLAELEKEQDELLYQLPNIPCYDVPAGKTANDNKVVREFGQRRPAEGLVPHWELAEKYQLIDFELGNKIAGAGFPVYKNKGARLQRAMLNFFLDENTKAGYSETQPPIVVNEDSAFGTGQLPDKEGQMYHVQNENLYLIPTAEVPLTNIYRNVMLSHADLPQKITGYTPCFRREAGSYGKDVRGLNRLHQFDK